jgi:hypothetical protein
MKEYEYLRKMIRTLLLFCTVLLFSSFKHPFYLGITDIKYSAAEKSIQLSVKLFTNDLEYALQKTQNQKIDLINDVDKKKMGEILNSYVIKRLKININSKLQSLSFIGYEHENDAVWMYFEIVNSAKPYKIEVENTLLYDYLKSQNNIVHCEVDGEKKSSKLSPPEKHLSFSF